MVWNLDKLLAPAPPFDRAAPALRFAPAADAANVASAAPRPAGTGLLSGLLPFLLLLSCLAECLAGVPEEVVGVFLEYFRLFEEDEVDFPLLPPSLAEVEVACC